MGELRDMVARRSPRRTARLCFVLTALALGGRCSSQHAPADGGTGGQASAELGGRSGTDGATDGPPCPGEPTFHCFVVEEDQNGGGIICGDLEHTPLCVQGAWVCQAGTSSDLSRCTCSTPPLSCFVCTPSGWVCPDAATNDASSVQPDAANDGGGGGTGGGGAGGSDGGSAGPCGGCAVGDYCQTRTTTGGGVGGGSGGPASSTTRSCVPYPSACTGGGLTCNCLCAQACPQGGGAQINCSCDGALTSVTCTILGV